MNILYVACNETFPSYQAGYTHIYNICKGMTKLGNKVYVIAKSPGTKNDHVHNGINIHYIADRKGLTSPLRAIREIVECCKKYNIDIIHERYSIPGGYGIFAAKILGIPSVLEINSPLAEEIYGSTPLFYGIHLMNKIQYFLSDVIITQTPILRNIIKIHTKKDIYVIPNGADTVHFRSGRPVLGIKSRYRAGKKKIICYVGSFNPWHGVVDLIKAFSLIRKGNVLMLIGSGSGFQECKELVGKLSLQSDVIFTGPVEYQKLPEYLNAADILVAPFNTKTSDTIITKRSQTFRKYGMWWSPVKIFEYMSMGKPIIASDVGMMRHYLGNGGILYEEGDIEALAKSMNTVIKNPYIAKKIGLKARKMVLDNFTWEMLAKKTLKVYHSLLGV